MPHNEHSFNRENKYPGSHLEKTLFLVCAMHFYERSFYCRYVSVLFSPHTFVGVCRLRLKTYKEVPLTERLFSHIVLSPMLKKALA